mgnify:FL=1
MSFGGVVKLHMPSLLWQADDVNASFRGSVIGDNGTLIPYAGNQINVEIDVLAQNKLNLATMKGKTIVRDAPAGKFSMKKPPSGLFPEEQASGVNGLVNLVLVEE